MATPPKDRPKRGWVVVHAKKLSNYRGVNQIPNLIYESCCRNERDAAPFVKLVGTDFRSEEILAQMEQKRLDAKEDVCEVICDEYETNKIDSIRGNEYPLNLRLYIIMDGGETQALFEVFKRNKKTRTEYSSGLAPPRIKKQKEIGG